MPTDPRPDATHSEALAWISDLLRRHGVRFQLVGGDGLDVREVEAIER